MNVLQALVMGIVQGATEFIPVSSSGHLVLVPWALGWPATSLTYDTVVHLGTLLAVVTYFWRDLLEVVAAGWQSLCTRRIEGPTQRLAWLIVVSAIPGALLGVLFSDFFEYLFSYPLAVGCFLLLTGTVLALSDRLGRRARRLDSLRLSDALWMGLAQGAAICPGISRSGATIGAGLFAGLERRAAARFSFLMVVPIIAGAAGLQVAKAVVAGLDGREGLLLLVGLASSAVSGYVAIGFLLRYLQRNTLVPFAFYCWSVGLLAVLLALVGWR